MSDVSHEQPRIYLDNAATSWPKPEEVYVAVDHYLRVLGAPAGRSGYAEAAIVERGVEEARRRLAKLVGLTDPSHLIFTLNGTDSLNLVLHGLLGEGDHVVTTVVEHNSVLRPLAALQETVGVSVTRVGCDAAGVVDPQEVHKALRPNTRLVAISHASNVTGAMQPVAEIAYLARAAEALVLCDAAQTAGHMPIDMEQLGIDFLASSGHKALLGPLGTGMLAIRPEAAPRLKSVRQGGTGTSSDSDRQPETLPAKFESGNLNVAGILGLSAGVEFLQKRGVAAIECEGRARCRQLMEGLREIPGLAILGPEDARDRVPLVSVVLSGYDPQEVALGLDAVYRIQVRPGLHCAPLMHQALGTSGTGGTVRLSMGAFTTEAEIDAAITAVAEIAVSEMQI
ncbi:MAG: aminotransferase class V-fold PLP-dependent enzyme [Planctomycetota bacterium]|nr:MAG: aminotransferase class V-fold PLP-dependent enzyme [Planctomycetota bacterium]